MKHPVADSQAGEKCGLGPFRLSPAAKGQEFAGKWAFRLRDYEHKPVSLTASTPHRAPWFRLVRAGNLVLGGCCSWVKFQEVHDVQISAIDGCVGGSGSVPRLAPMA